MTSLSCVHDELVAHWLKPAPQSAPAPSKSALFSGQPEESLCLASGLYKMSGTPVPSQHTSTKYGWLWESQPGALSDTLLRILQLPSAKGGASAEEIAAKQLNPTLKEEYRLHSVVLAANSAYFRHRLLTPVRTTQPAGELYADADHEEGYETYDSGRSSNSSASKGCAGEGVTPQQPQPLAQQGQQDTTCSTGATGDTRSMYLLEERLHPFDMSAAKAVLCHMYTEELMYDSPSHLVTILKIADKWKVKDTIDACRTAFSRLQPDELDLEVIKQVYCLEGIIHDVQNFAELVAAVQSRLVRMFQDVVDVVQTPATRNAFLQLPFAAVVALLNSPDLIVDTENSVVVAANLWLTQGKGRNTTLEQRRFLAGVIQLSGVTPSYLCGVMPNLRWFTVPGQPFVSWAQALPGAYYNELQERMVSSKAKQVVHAGRREAIATPNPIPMQTPITQPAVASTSAATSPAPPRNTCAPTPTPLPHAIPSAGSSASSPASSAGTVFGPGWSSPSALAQTSRPSETQTSKAQQSSLLPRTPSSNKRNASESGSSAIPTDGTAAVVAARALEPAPHRMLRDQNLEIECDIESSRLRQYIADGYAGLQVGTSGFRGVHVHSEVRALYLQSSYFRGFMWGIKLVFGFSTGHGADGKPPPFTVTPSPFASLPPGEEGMRPLVAPVTVTFSCAMEALGPQGTAYASATYQGASYIKPGEEHVSSIGISNFFKRVPQQHIADSWAPFLVNDKLRLRLKVMGATVE